jgi:hypothetical protein
MQLDGILHYAVAHTRVGRVLVLMSAQGVVDALLLPRHFTAETYLDLVRPWFAESRLIRDDGSRWHWVEAVAARFDGIPAETRMPVDLLWSAPEVETRIAS